MIFLDANVFLRYLTDTETSYDLPRQAQAAVMFEAIERGDTEATTSEAILAEVAFLLSDKRHYAVPAAAAAEYLSTIIRFPGLKLPRGRKRLYLRALAVWAEHPRLGFVDALTAAMVEAGGLQLATFDRDFDALPHLERWQPTGSESD